MQSKRTKIACLLAGVAMQATAATHDFDGDGRDDVAWRHADSGSNVQWPSAAPAMGVRFVSVPDRQWRIAGVGDFDGDGRADLLWRHSGNGSNAVWRSGNAATQLRVAPVRDLQWHVLGIGDFDGDGRSDVLWRHPTLGLRIWRAADALAAHAIPTLQFVAIADLDGDGRDDLVGQSGFYAPSGVRLFAWRGADAGRAFDLGIMSLYEFAKWQLQAVGDFDGDGREDLFWRNVLDGRNVGWRGGFPTDVVPLAGVNDLAWRVASAGDYDGDGRSDLFWRHQARGSTVVWSGADGHQGHYLAQVSSRWMTTP